MDLLIDTILIVLIIFTLIAVYRQCMDIGRWISNKYDKVPQQKKVNDYLSSACGSRYSPSCHSRNDGVFIVPRNRDEKLTG